MRSWQNDDVMKMKEIKRFIFLVKTETEDKTLRSFSALFISFKGINKKQQRKLNVE